MAKDKKYMQTFWTNNSYFISWFDEDKILIDGPNFERCVMDGGDFESMLSALCASFNAGRTT